MLKKIMFSFLAILMTYWMAIDQEVSAANCENPDSLTFAMVPTEETVAELELYKPVTDRMEKLTGKKIQFFMPTSYASVVEGLLSHFVDVAVLGPYTYVIANSKDPTVEVFATYAKRPGHMQEEGPGYRGVLISKKGSKYTSIKSLKGSLVGLTDPGSTSGNLMPRVAFTKVIGMELEKFFDKDLNIKEKIEKGQDIFKRGFNLKKVEIDSSFPNFIIENKEKLKEWIIQ